MQYAWKHSKRGGLKADTAGKILEQIHTEQGGITADMIVDEARKARSPLHSYFEWDDNKAAKAYRLSQASHMLRNIEVVVEREEQEPLRIRAFHNIEYKQERFYTTVTAARQNEELWEQVKQQALSEIKNWQNKYKHITEFEVIFDAIGQVR